MSKYLLDTSICIYIMKRTPEQVAQHMDRCLLGDVVMSSITYAELEHGVLCVEDPDEAREQLDILVKAAPVSQGGYRRQFPATGDKTAMKAIVIGRRHHSHGELTAQERR